VGALHTAAQQTSDHARVELSLGIARTGRLKDLKIGIILNVSTMLENSYFARSLHITYTLEQIRTIHKLRSWKLRAQALPLGRGHQATLDSYAFIGQPTLSQRARCERVRAINVLSEFR